MGLLVDGAWKEDVPRARDGHFVRPATAFHNYITPDGSPGPTGKGGFPAEAGRYHLYVSLACPWASRALIVRKLTRKKRDERYATPADLVADIDRVLAPSRATNPA